MKFTTEKFMVPTYSRDEAMASPQKIFCCPPVPEMKKRLHHRKVSLHSE
jgi:hypothetical protein